jgi:spore coat polysaccharide biosynthesis predicted glycosyltransferase SpsG
VKLVILANASPSIGTGHVMRALSVAEEFMKQGWQIDFAGKVEGVPWLSKYIKQIIPNITFESFKNLDLDHKEDFLLIDSYDLSVTDPFIQKENWKKILAIVEDFTPPVFADFYFHPGSTCSWTPPLNYHNYQYLEGIEFISVRESIREISFNRFSNPTKFPKIVIVGGGSDPFKFAPNLVNLLLQTKLEFSADVFSTEIINSSNDRRFQFFQLGQSFEDSIKTAELILCTSGTVSWEMLSAGFPIGIALATRNQELNYNYQHSFNLAVKIGENTENGKWKFFEKNITNLIMDEDFRCAISENAKSAHIGFGSKLIFELVKS